VERRLFTLRTASLRVLPEGSAPIRVLHLSDLHLAPWQRAKQAWVRGLADLAPDLVINTGDNMGHPDALPTLRYALRPFAGIPGVFVMGSNDYFGPTPKNPFAYFRSPSTYPNRAATLDIEAERRAFTEDLGWTDLDNRAARIPVGDAALEFFGVDDPHREFDDLDAMRESLASVRAASDRATARNAIASIGVAHAPYRRVLDALTAAGADLLVAGHTHGGQVRIPGYGALVTNCDLPRDQVSGVSAWRSAGRSAILAVSAGLGTSIYAPVRFACRPEASLYTLVG
jgi:predicted MPP superfamily phosphohydrolase